MTTPATPFGTFFLPGPTEVREPILRAMLHPMIGHRGADIEALMARIAPKLQRVFRTTQPVFTATNSATGLMEGGVRNLVKQRVLCLIDGAFSERFHKAARNSGLQADALEVKPGEYNAPEQVADALKKTRYDVVTVVHSETSTGVLNPIQEIAEVVHAADDVMLVVDTVSSMAGVPVETDAWKLDYVLTGSQKCFALPPGLAFGTANARAVARAKVSTNRGLYFDLMEQIEYWHKNQTPNTPAVSLLYALDAQLDAMEAEGLEARWARHRAMAEATWQWVAAQQAKGVDAKILAPEGYRSPAVTCILPPTGMTGSQVAAAMKAKGFVIATGYGPLKDMMVRVGHMGDHTVAEVEAVLAALGEVFAA